MLLKLVEKNKGHSITCLTSDLSKNSSGFRQINKHRIGMVLFYDKPISSRDAMRQAVRLAWRVWTKVLGVFKLIIGVIFMTASGQGSISKRLE